MLTLAIETSSTQGSIAILRGDVLAGQRPLDPQVGSARTLAPAIEQLHADLQLKLAQMDLIAVSTGPGSFTGLRVGITTAKTLAYALGCDIVAIDTLDAIAEQLPASCLRETTLFLHAVIDAQRRELFLGRYTRARVASAAGSWERAGETQIVAAEKWLRELDSRTVVTGPALKRLAVQLPPSAVAAPAECWTPQAATVGRLGLVAWQAGRRDDLYRIVPTYLRPSYAEEKASPSAECRVKP